MIAPLFALAIAASLEQQPIFRSDVQLVEVGAVVLDRKGRPVIGLKLEDFVLREDGKPVKIVAFVSMVGERDRAPGTRPGGTTAPTEPSGRFVVLLLDDMFISPLRTPKIRELATKFIDRLNGSDEIAIVKLNGGQSVSTISPKQARAALAKYTHDRPLPPSSRGEWQARIDSAMDTVAELARQLSVVRHRRKALVFIGATALFSPRSGLAPAYSHSPSWHAAVQTLATANASLYYIDPRGLVSVGPDASVSSPGTFGFSGSDEAFDHPIAFAHETGGEAFVRSNLFDRAIQRIWRETADYYLLGYEPPVNDGKPHKINVEVRVNGLDVRARKTR